MKKNSTKRALLMSALALLLCMSMLVGSTFAWFTDSVVSANNKIQAGTLDVQLLMFTGADYEDISESTQPIFGPGSIAQNVNGQTLWEPGKTQVAYLAIKNNGSLALKYTVGLNVVDTDAEQDLYEVMQYAITPDAQPGDVTAWDRAAGQGVVLGTQQASGDVALAVGATHYFALSIHMMEEAGNKYQGGEVMFDLTVLAGQDTVEFDSFDELYDEDATYPLFAAGAAEVTGESEYDIGLYRIDRSKVGSAVVAAENIAGDANAVNIEVRKTKLYNGITIADDKTARTYDIYATGLVENFPKSIMIELNIGTGLTGVEVYHYADKLTPASYNPNTGLVKFEATSFSPYTFVYDKVAVEQPAPAPDGSDKPVAQLVEMPALAGTKIDWNNYGGFYPSRGEEQTLDVIYKFVAPDTNIEEDPYKDWICDFYVMLKDEGNAATEIPEGALTLGGHYGDFGWVGFDNPAGVYTNEFIPLLQSVAGGWTYEGIATFVGEFMCGVAGNSDAVKGMTFVVELRLVNPNADDTAYPAEGEYVVTNRVEYTFN